MAAWGHFPPQQPHYNLFVDRIIAMADRERPRLGEGSYQEYIHESVPPDRRATIIAASDVGPTAVVVLPLLDFEVEIRNSWELKGVGAVPQIPVPEAMEQALQLAPAGGV